MSDSNQIPGAEAAMNTLSTASKSMQDFAAEMQRMSKDSVESTSQLMEKMRGAKSLEEMMTIQTNFMQHSFSNYADYTRRFSELMMTLPMEFAKQSQAAFQQGTESFSKAAEQAGQQIQNAGEEFKEHHG